MKNHITLVNNHTLFVEGASDRVTAAQILEENSNESPLGLMFAGAGTLVLKFGTGAVVPVPYRKIRLTDPAVTVQNMILEAEGTALEGVGIGLPDDVVRLHAAFEAAKCGMPYHVDTFLKQYLGDLERIGSLFMDHFETARIDGMMAQVITDPRVGEDEVGLGATMMRKFHQTLITAGHDELKEVDTLDGMIILLQRYPVVSKTGGRWVKLRLIQGASVDKILVNGKAWKEKHDGDEDGDPGYIGINSKSSFSEVEEQAAYPDLKVMPREDLPETKAADPVQTVVNMRARSVIGAQHTFFHGLARAYAVMLHRKDGGEGFKRAYRGTFEVYHPMAEGVFDKRKDEGGMNDFQLLVCAMEDHLAGKTVMVEPFENFLHPERYQKFVNVMELVGGSTRLARGTVFGQYLMAAKNKESHRRAFSTIVDALEGMGIEPLHMIDAVQADGLGEKILPVPMPQQSSKKPKKQAVIKLEVSGEIKTVKDVFESIHLNGSPVLRVAGMEEHEDGSIEVGVRLVVPGHKSVVISIDWPSISKVPCLPADEQHRIIKVEGMNTRLFQPILKMGEGRVRIIDFPLWFATQVAETIEAFLERMGEVDKKRFQSQMDRHLRAAIRNLIILNDKDKAAAKRELIVRMFEYRVEVEGGTLSGELANFEEILTKLNEMGFDVTCTSKNHPGRVVTKVWKHGVARWLWAINPFAPQMDLKRRVEPREIRQGLEFHNPITPPLRTMGAKIPAELASVTTTLNVAAIDLEGLNIFLGSDDKCFCFDTLLVTASGIEKLKLKKLPRHADDAEQKERIIQQLKSEGFEKIEVEEILESAGNGLHHKSYDIVAMKEKGIEDIGKIKACVGPIKGVMNPVPFQLFTEDGIEIDLIVPHDTIARKRAVDAVNYMMAANAGLTEIDPDNQPVLEVIKKKIMREDGTELGEFITGPLPFFRPVQTGRSTTDIRTGEHGIKVQNHTMIMVGGVDFHNTPTWAKEDFAQLVNTRKEVKMLMATRALAVENEEAPTPTEVPEYV